MSKFDHLSAQEIAKLPIDDLRILRDLMPTEVGRPAVDYPHISYFANPEEYLAALRSIGYAEAEAVLKHERAHGDCAMALGVTSVRYGIEYEGTPQRGAPLRAVSTLTGPVVLPRLAAAAIQVAPKDPSVSDVLAIRHLGYRTVERVRERILVWNLENELQIPIF